MNYKYVAGVDEVGRGPVAGPVFVCAFFAQEDALADMVSGAPAPLRDSKKLTERMRNAWFEYLEHKRKAGLVRYAVSSAKSFEIDRSGISVCISECVRDCLERLVSKDMTSDTLVLLDGGLRAPVHFAQKTIIKGDENEVVISLASIVAKVLRDKHMEDLHRNFPQYEFDAHKGYGTKKHMEAIQTYGPCEEHRLSFLGNILGK